MWLRSDLFAHDNTSVYYPEKWMKEFNHEYFERIRHKIKIHIRVNKKIQS